MPKLYYENISKADFDQKFDSFETLNEKFEFLNNYLLSYGIDEVAEREETNVVNLLDNPAEDFIHHAREKFLAASLAERDKYNEANIEQLNYDIVNPNEKADSEIQKAMQHFISKPAQYVSFAARARAKEIENNEIPELANDKNYKKNLKYVAREFYSINKIFNTNENKRHVKDVLDNSLKACNMPENATANDVVNRNKGGFFENMFNTTSKEYKAFVEAYKAFNEEGNPNYGNDEELEKATRAYLKHKIPNFNLPNQMPEKEEIERFSGTSRGRVELCAGVLQAILQRRERNIMTGTIEANEMDNAKVNQQQFQNKVNKDVEKDEIANVNTEVIDNKELQVENQNEVQSSND